MAQALVGGSFLSAFLNVLFDRMASSKVLDFFKSQQLNVEQLKKLTTTLIYVRGVLDDAEERQITRLAVQRWLNDLKDAVYDADDLLDEIDYEAMRLELETTSQTSENQVRKFFSSLVNPFKKAKEEKEAKLEEILGRLDYLVKEKDILGLRESIGEKPSSHKIPTTSLVDESVVYGRDGDKEAIIKLLLSNDANAKNPDVIPIVGMGGVGKTTLAQLVYNDSRVQELFSVKAWVCVSEDFDVFKVTGDILKEIGSVTCDSKTPNQLQLELREKLIGKMLLLVLDDVWNDKYADWDILLRPLKSGAQGSKIIVTTRSESVASVMRTVPTHHLKELTDDNCWFLFAKHAFDDGTRVNPDLEAIGREIVRKCNGLPLAAKTLGGLLCSKRDVEEWEMIWESNIWDLSEDSILPALRLSYYYLPSHLKPCFAYCAIFPKDYEFEKEELVLLWMAEGFLAQPKQNKEMEEVGSDYFHDLVLRSFFQQSGGYGSRFVMHDLINDLAKFVSEEFCFRLEGDNWCRTTKSTHHFSYATTKYDTLKKFECIYEAQLLRTFLPLSRGWQHNCLQNEITDVLLPTLKYLRVLSLYMYRNVIQLPDSIGNLKHLRYLNLSGTSIKALPKLLSTLYNLQTLILHECKDLASLPDSIGNLKHLRYLNLQRTPIKKLPESMSSLFNLQTLVLFGCVHIVKLPTTMGRLINLRHLDIRGTKVQEMPLQMGKLTKLRTLTDYFLGKQSGSGIKELGELQHLCGELCIWNLQNIVDTQDALQANLKGKKLLQGLELRWDGDTHNSMLERDVFEQLLPHKNLERLSIFGYGSSIFPDWITDDSFSSIMSLEITSCKYCSSLPALGNLPSLKDLSIKTLDGVTVVGQEFYGRCTSVRKPFGSLEILKFQKMPRWREWVSAEGGAFPHLRELYIQDCPTLREVWPSHLPSLTTLKIEGCPALVTSLPEAPSLFLMKLKDGFHDVLLQKLPSGLYSFKIDKLYPDSPVMWMEKMGYCFAILEEIEIQHSDSLKCFPLELFPKLKCLEIFRCPNFESLCEQEWPLGDFTSLTCLKFVKCPNFVSFPNRGLPAPHLKKLYLLECPELKSLPECMLLLLPSLVDLKISDCPKLESFPDEDWPSNLESLEIHGCGELNVRLMQSDLRRLTSLSSFVIGGCDDVESFPQKMLLPSTLTSLTISNLRYLKSLDYNGLQHVTSLRELWIQKCFRLQPMPRDMLPSSLSSLRIRVI